MLILDVLDDGVPAAVVVNQITIARRVNDVQSKTHTVLLDDVGNRVNLGGGADRLVGHHSTLRVDQMRRENSVDQGRFAQSSLACRLKRNALVNEAVVGVAKLASKQSPRQERTRNQTYRRR